MVRRAAAFVFKKSTADSQMRCLLAVDNEGYCQDHIFVKDSTISQAGKGAFSRRHLKKGSLIITAPAIAVTRDFMSLNDTGKDFPTGTNSMQLMYNYHFGHKNSSVLFFPLNHLFAINHNSKRSKSGKEPNARVEFSTTERKSLYFQSLPLKDLKKQKYSTMVLDVVATRDIEPDEEVFIDYGQDWEDAWDKHVKEWKSPCSYFSGHCYQSSKQVHMMNDNKFNRGYHEWSETHFSACTLNQTQLSEDPDFFYVSKTVLDGVEDAIDSRVKQSIEGVEYDHEGFAIPGHVNSETKSSHFPCKILESWEAEGHFDVLYLFHPNSFPSPQQREDVLVVLKFAKLPAEFVQFHVKPFKSDMHSPDAFRHDIAISDEHFPALWKDLE
jgi:hypothetical protein